MDESLFDPAEYDGTRMLPPHAQRQRPVDDQAPYVGRRHPETAHAMQRRILPKSGTLRRRVYDLIVGHGGLTDDELEQITGRSHQSISGARATLKKDGWLRDSGQRRRNRYGNEAVVWTVPGPPAS